ncbi:MAG TPA: hypothetical protein VFD82_24815 [Planctomycetota bacterium]|nr:hypothetical protein [Planctomycetota bacterium]
MTVHARAAFQYGIDDLVDVALRNVNRLPGRRSQVLVVGLLLGLAAGAVGKLLDPDDTPFAIAIGALVAVAVPFLYPKLQRAATRRNFLELYGSGPFTCTVELHDDHMLWRDDQQDRQVQTRLPWRELREVRVEGGDWIVESKAGISVLNADAFASAAEADVFWATFERLSAAPARSAAL